MNKMTLILCTVICLILIGKEGLAQVNARAISTTVCEITAHPGRFDGKMVIFSAQYESDGIERSVLTDSDCEGSGIGIATPRHFEGEAVLRKAMGTGRPGTLDKTIKGTFLGKFKWQPEKMPKRVLTLIEVRNLSMVMK